MKIHQLKTVQRLNMSLEEAWDFFSSPLNLGKITPAKLKFHILSNLGDGKMYPGQLIKYHVTPLLGIKMYWVTEITHVEDGKFFVDEQRVGPYAMWHHQHHFKEIPGGVEMTDIVDYGLPLGPLGAIAHGLFVKRQVEEIFNYRYKVLEELFGEPQVPAEAAAPAA